MKAILDTGPWVALIDRSEANHERCVTWLEGYTGELYSTEAVLTEVLYLLDFSIKAQNAAIEFVLSSVVDIVPFSIECLRRARALMNKYADLPMDYADATILCLSMETGLRNVVTFDQKHFNIYTVKGLPYVIFP